MMDRFLSLLGLAQKSGNLISGEDTCERLIKSSKIHLVLVSADAAQNTQKKFKDMTKNRAVKLIIIGNREELSRAIGKTNRTVYAIRDKNFADKILETINKECPKFLGGEIQCQK